jgi:hypothetical protein
MLQSRNVAATGTQSAQPACIIPVRFVEIITTQIHFAVQRTGGLMAVSAWLRRAGSVLPLVMSQAARRSSQPLSSLGPKPAIVDILTRSSLI